MTSGDFNSLLDHALSTEGDVTTVERVSVIRDAMQSDEAEDHPSLGPLEEAWKYLSQLYDDGDEQPLIDRKKMPGEDAVSSFVYYLEMGFYPPPEILFALALGLRRYEDGRGSVSLDAAVFGKEHSKWSSKAFVSAKRDEYRVFHLYVVLATKKAVEESLPPPSLTEIAEDYANDVLAGTHSGTDADSIVRGYHRWRKQLSSRDG